MAPAKYFGKTCRDDDAVNGEAGSRADTIENKSGVFERVPQLPMLGLCSHCNCAATRWLLALGVV
jgi:hypothetical protein